MTPPTNPRVAKIVEDGLFAAFESGWFDNTGDIGDGWSEVKDDLIVEMKAKLLLEEGERVEGCEIGTMFNYRDGDRYSVDVTLPPGGSCHKMLGHTCTLVIHPTEEGHDD